MISTLNVKCNAAKPNFPLQPMFAFMGSPSSLRILDVPKSIGNWAITSVKVVVTYPDNIMVEKNAVRNGSVWVATVEGCNIAGKVANGYEVLADGKDEDGNDVTGYVLGKGDVYIIENDTDISRLLDKIAVRYIEDIPDVPTKGDLMNSNGELRLFDGNNWILISTGEHSAVYDSQITIQKNGTSVGSFTVNASEPKTIDIPVPSRTSDIENDSGFITVAAIPSTISSFENDVGYITEAAIPSNVGAFTNDVGYLTASSSAITDKRDYSDLTYPGSVYPSETHRIREFDLNIEGGHNPSRYTLNKFSTNVPNYGSMWANDEEYWNYAVTTSNGEDFTFNKYGEGGEVATFTMSDVTAGAITFTMTDDQIEYTCHLSASMYETTLALKDYVDAAIPSNVSELNNDVGYVTASAIPSNVSELNNDVGFITASAISGKRDYTDLSYNKYDTSDHTYRGITSWEINGLKIGAQTYNITTNNRGTGNPTYGTYWNNGAAVVYTRDLNTFFFANGGDALTSFTLSLSRFDYTRTWEDSSGVQNVTFHANTDFLALKRDLPTNVSELENDVGYLTASSSAFVAKRDKTDMDAVVGTTYASWNLSALHSATYSPALELKWGTYNVFGQEQECWLVDDEYRQVCFFLLPELNMLYWGVRNQDGSYIAGYGETITLSSDELSIATINGVAEITCTRTSKEGSPEISTIATLKDLNDFKNINEKRDWWDNTYQASVDATGKYTINKFSVVIGGISYNLDQFSASGGTSTWKSSSSYPTITTTDGLNFVLNSDSDTMAYFTMDELKPGPAKGTVGGSNFNVYANFKLTTFALKDWVDANCTTYSYVDANLNVSGIGCSTVTMSGIYSDLTSFSYNVVVQ